MGVMRRPPSWAASVGARSQSQSWPQAAVCSYVSTLTTRSRGRASRRPTPQVRPPLARVLGKQALMPGFVLEASADSGLKGRPGSIGAYKELVKAQTNHACGLAGETVVLRARQRNREGVSWSTVRRS